MEKQVEQERERSGNRGKEENKLEVEEKNDRLYKSCEEKEKL